MAGAAVVVVAATVGAGNEYRDNNAKSQICFRPEFLELNGIIALQCDLRCDDTARV